MKPGKGNSLYHIGFIIEQTLGHVTHSQNLQKYVSRDHEVKAFWGLPAWEATGLVGRIPLYRSNWTVRAGLRARRALDIMQRETIPDALFFHTQVTAVLSPDWLRRFPSVVSLDATPKQYDELGGAYAHATGPQWLERWKWRLNRACFRQARHLVAWSEWAKQGLVDEYEIAPEKVTVLPPGVDPRAWAHPGLRIPNGTVRILFVGGDLGRKGGRLLLDAFRCLREIMGSALPTQYFSREESGIGPSVELHLVTRDTVAPEPGVFVYNGLQPNSDRLKQLFYESDIFCLPTQGDCLPMVLSEAGAAGLPSVSTRLAAIPEIVRDGETGFTIPSGNVEALVAALQRLVLDPDLRLRQGQAAVQIVRQGFDAGRNADRLLDLMKQIASKPKAEGLQ